MVCPKSAAKVEMFLMKITDVILEINGFRVDIGTQSYCIWKQGVLGRVQRSKNCIMESDVFIIGGS